MKIVLNALPYKPQSSGIGVMLRDLFTAYLNCTKQQTVLLLSHDSPSLLTNSLESSTVRIPYRQGQVIRRNLYQSLFIGPKFCRHTVFVTTDSKIPLLLPKSANIYTIVTDLAVYRMPEVYQKSRVWFWKLQYRTLLKRTRRFAAVSEFTKRDMVEQFGLLPEQIDVIPCAADSSLRREENTTRLDQVRKKYALPEQYILFVGNFNPRKNLRRMMQAFDLLCENTELPHKLVIVGATGWKFDTETETAAIRHRENIIFAGYVETEDMAAVYSLADLFLFVTLYEGFGIPIIEAQQCGIPVLAGDNSSMPEVGGDGAWYADAQDTTDIYEKMRYLLQNSEKRTALIQKGYINAERFSWEKSAAILNKVLQQVINEKVSR